MRENEIWKVVKNCKMEEKINIYDAYVFILDHIQRLEKLIERKVPPEDIPRIIDQALIYLSNI